MNQEKGTPQPGSASDVKAIMSLFDASPTWEQMRDAGGTDAWIQQELRRRSLLDEGVDTATLSDRERKQYKVRREEERRVRRILQKIAWSAYQKAHLVHLGLGIFHHDTADLDRFDIAEPEVRRRDNDLPEIPDAEALAKRLELPMSRLRWLTFHREVDTGTHYHHWRVPKRTGGERLISAPKPDLKRIQHWITHNISEHLPVHGAAHGFVPGRSILSNAQVHAGAEVIIKLDLHQFFPSVTFPRVKGLFRKAGYGEQVATVLALVCTDSPRVIQEIRGKTHYVAEGPRGLPQGAPTSPSIANAVCLGLDCRLGGLAKKLGFRYTRYADDLAFSWSQPTQGPNGSAALNPSNSSHPTPPFHTLPLNTLLKAVEQIVQEEGFRLNPKKTRVMRPGRAQKVTGLVVNRLASGSPRPRVTRKVRRQVRAALHNRAKGKARAGESLETVQGLAAYIHMTDRLQGRRLLMRIQQLQTQLQTQHQTPRNGASSQAEKERT